MNFTEQNHSRTKKPSWTAYSQRLCAFLAACRLNEFGYEYVPLIGKQKSEMERLPIGCWIL
jgi:hypothetical protein